MEVEGVGRLAIDDRTSVKPPHSSLHFLEVVPSLSLVHGHLRGQSASPPPLFSPGIASQTTPRYTVSARFGHSNAFGSHLTVGVLLNQLAAGGSIGDKRFFPSLLLSGALAEA